MLFCETMMATTSNFVLSPHEDILYCTDAIFRKQSGILSITNSRLVWVANSIAPTQNSMISLSLHSITKFMVSVATSPVCLLKVIKNGADSTTEVFVFQFQGDDARERQSKRENEKAFDIFEKLISDVIYIYIYQVPVKSFLRSFLQASKIRHSLRHRQLYECWKLHL